MGLGGAAARWDFELKKKKIWVLLQGSPSKKNSNRGFLRQTAASAEQPHAEKTRADILLLLRLEIGHDPINIQGVRQFVFRFVFEPTVLAEDLVHSGVATNGAIVLRSRDFSLAHSRLRLRVGSCFRCFRRRSGNSYSGYRIDSLSQFEYNIIFGSNSIITYGSVIKLMHEKTKFRLHSHDVPYGSGSGQQSVTGFPNVDDSNSYWIVRPTHDSSAKQGDTIRSGTSVRLQHMRTRKWLHSHLHASPISGNLEVSCFGGDGESDTGDYWRLEIEGNGKTWRQDQRVRLRHVDTGGYLHSHDKKYTRIAGGQQEVCGVREKRADNVWLAAEGVYLPTVESK
ncbi:hypothetical protein RD792_004669 [Penstemon davidsonii]|uniref:MIR domain-containing protein n=1 Tax=Penstemon davidsonii TaxID=160366 RepID=A0ABR0DII2_9LAMI|nr:hypothetical protein RD792_004669 [Penstemon davidsonii]